eukprot:Rmarinus@m.5118
MRMPGVRSLGGRQRRRRRPGNRTRAKKKNASEKMEFKWKSAIRKHVKAQGGEMKLKSLQKLILQEYKDSGAMGDEEISKGDLKKLFQEKIKKCSAVDVDSDSGVVRRR